MQNTNKSQLIEELAAINGITRSACEQYLNSLIHFIYETLKDGGKVNISGFGQFSTSYRAPRVGVNPRNPSQRITVPERNQPKFVAGEGFKSAVKLNK